VFDEEGIAFWLDHDMQLYATVLYTARVKDAVINLPVAEPEPALAPAKAKIARKIRLPIVHFDFDKYNIKKIYVPDLDEHVAYLKEHPTSPVTVEGHTDYMGSVQYNQKLSERRASAVRQYLIQQGIAPARIQTVGFGKLKPISDNKSAEGRAVNRRAEFEVMVDQ
jgi:OOP family OmpA-OmpF porin